MTSIQTSPYPLAFKVGNAAALQFSQTPQNAPIVVRTRTRSLEGMQKEALVQYGPTGTVWRMVSDEGPYLNGTDLAPFPLAFFTTGMVASYMTEIVALAKLRGIGFDDLEVVQDNLYSMEGSAIQGTMTGGALPVELTVKLRSNASHDALTELVSSAVAAAPANGILNGRLESFFSLHNDGRNVPLDPGKTVKGEHPAEQPELFDRVQPAAADQFAPDIVTKAEATQTVFGVEGGAGSSLQAEQKRTLHVRGTCRLRADGLKSIRVQLFKPIGSVFQFLSDDSAHFGGSERAPSGLAYLSAGIAFCFMTQIGRYAHIMKQNLESYRIIQDTRFGLPGASGGTNQAGVAYPVETHCDFKSSESDDVLRKMVQMGEQTCFLHAACRTPLRTKIRVQKYTAAAA
ncbi:MAG: OsmC family protein [Rhizobiales bacterium]|nr:OsmC family protein [Hyphomicrobiales bacterium]